MGPLVMRDPGDRFFYRGDVKGLQLRLYRPGDEALVDARADFARMYREQGSVLPAGPKWTLLDGHQVLAVGGFEVVAAEIWAGWAYAGDLTPRQWRFGALCARACAGWLMREEGCFINAIAADHEGAGPLLRRMGFTPRGERLFSFEEA